MELQGTLPDRLAEVCLAYSAGPVDEEEVQRSLSRSGGCSLGDTQCLPIACALVEGVEAQVCAQVRCVFLHPRAGRDLTGTGVYGLGCGLQHDLEPTADHLIGYPPEELDMLL